MPNAYLLDRGVLIGTRTLAVNNMVYRNINSMYNISLETNMNIQDAKCIIYKTEHSSFQIIHLINTNTLHYMLLSLPSL